MTQHIEWKTVIIASIALVIQGAVDIYFIHRVDFVSLTGADITQLADKFLWQIAAMLGIILGYKGATDIWGKKNSPIVGGDSK